MTKIFQLFKDLFKRFPLHFVFLFTMVFTQSFLNTLSVVAVAPITDLLLKNSIENSSYITKYVFTLLNSFNMGLNLLVVSIFFGSITLFNGLIAIVAQYALLKIKYDVMKYLLIDTISCFFRARFLFFSESNMGILLNSFLQELRTLGDTFGQMAQFSANSAQVVIFLSVPFFLSPKLTIIFLIISAICCSPLWYARRISYQLGKGNTETANVNSGTILEILSAAKLILGFGRQEIAIERYNKAFTAHAKVSVKFQTLQRGIYLLFTPLGIIAALTAMYIAYLDGTPFSEMAMVLFALYKVMPFIGQLLQVRTNIEGFVPAYEQIESLRKSATALEENRMGLKFEKFRDELRFENVSFSYPGRKPSLDGINLSIPKCKMTALVGKSGSGKTTAVDLILGLHKKDEGKLLLDGKELDLYEINSYRNHLGYVPQEPQLFNTTVRKNLLWAAPEASEKDIWKACSLANADQFVRNLPEKLDTILGDRGIRLSGGQRQRIALARALIRNPDLLILDEATSSLDTESERLILESIDNLSGEITIVVIAHRLATIKNADYIYVLDEGKVIEEGSYHELTKNSESQFAKMVLEQVV